VGPAASTDLEVSLKVLELQEAELSVLSKALLDAKELQRGPKTRDIVFGGKSYKVSFCCLSFVFFRLQHERYCFLRPLCAFLRGNKERKSSYLRLLRFFTAPC